MTCKTAVFGLSLLLTAATAMACVGTTNAALQAALNKKLSKYHNVSASVDDCVAVLNGHVTVLTDKRAAGRTARRFRGLTSVVNHIVVVTPYVNDVTLVDNVTRKLLDDRDQNANMLSFLVSSYHGSVTVSGLVNNSASRDNILALIASTAGVRSLNNSITLDQLSAQYPLLATPSNGLNFDFSPGHAGMIVRP